MGQTNRRATKGNKIIVMFMRYRIVSHLMIALLWFLPTPKTEAADEITIVTFGDSTTASRGELNVYSDILRAELPERGMPVRVINAGIGGNHTGHARARLEQDVLSHAPVIAIIQFGINDAAVDVWKDPRATGPRVPIADFEENLRQMIDSLKHRDVNVILMTPNPLRWTNEMRKRYGKPPYQPHDANGFNVTLEVYAETVRRIAEVGDLPLIDVYQCFQQYPVTESQAVSDLLLDGIHPNQTGHRLIADRLIPLVMQIRSTVSDPHVGGTAVKRIPTTHASQWQHAADARLITDMTRCFPADGLSKRREHAKWKVFPYETAAFSGQNKVRGHGILFPNF